MEFVVAFVVFLIAISITVPTLANIALDVESMLSNRGSVISYDMLDAPLSPLQMR